MRTIADLGRHGHDHRRGDAERDPVDRRRHRDPGGLQAWDNISIEGNSKNIWVDHAEFWDGQDGNADVVKGSDNVTFTWSIFGYSKNGDHNLSNLIASSDNEPVSEGKLNITFMFNWWTGVAERQPRCRYGWIHVVNNLYTEDTSVGPSRLGVSNGLSATRFCSPRRDGSVQEATGNLFEGCSGNQTGSGDAFDPPYEYKSFMVPASQVKELVQEYAGATLSSPTACSP
ncbi:pectate lyase family protein [Sorangium sp. So ce385]|uniref:pectate lyase family protein n=1 Tax=Sorangium sp. So ce385 TaxID=3133308 RepID=UPI003F5AF91D